MTLLCCVCELPVVVRNNETFYIEDDYEEENITTYVRHDPKTCIKLLKEEILALNELIVYYEGGDNPDDL